MIGNIKKNSHGKYKVKIDLGGLYNISTIHYTPILLVSYNLNIYINYIIGIKNGNYLTSRKETKISLFSSMSHQVLFTE